MDNYEEKLGELSTAFSTALNEFNEKTKKPTILGVLVGQRLSFNIIDKDGYENISA